MRVCCLGTILFIAACGPTSGEGESDLGSRDGGTGGPGESEFADAAPPTVCTKMDILFVIDDSGSMEQEQTNLVENFPKFIDVLETFTTGSDDILDYRVAVTTTGRDVDFLVDSTGGIPLPFPVDPVSVSEQGDNGKMRQECGMSRPWIERADGEVSDTFSCVADVGTGGPSLEMPLLAAKMALGERMSDGTNAGFLREDALLGIVFLTDEDDCSRTDNGFTVEDDKCENAGSEYLGVGETVTFLDDLVGSRGRWATAVIAGPGPGSCSSAEFGDALEATRLQDFVSQTGDNAVFSSICQGDLTVALAEAIETFDAACKTFNPIE